MLVILLVLGSGWVVGWRYGAQLVLSKTAQTQQRIAEKGGRLECDGKRIEGFPFRLGVMCDRVEFAPPRGGAFSVGKFRSAAQLYYPGRFVSELDGPAALQLPDGRRFKLQWSEFRGSGHVTADGIDRFSAALANPVLSEGEGTAGGQDLANAQSLQIHARRSPEKDGAVDYALSLAGLAHPVSRFPAHSLELDVRLDDFVSQMKPGALPLQHIREQGASGILRNVSVTPAEGGQLAAKGTFKISRDGLIDADLKVRASEIRLLASFAIAFAPQENEAISNIAGLLEAIAPDPTEQDGKTRTLPVRISKGKISIGFLPVGEIPALW
jgi:hypothetical protein